MMQEMELVVDVPANLTPPKRIKPSPDGKRPVVAIIGAGFSGTMAAIHLRHVLPQDHVIYLFDRTGRFARGPAYSASDAPHLLNVRSVNMSALVEDPGHFERWLAEQTTRLPNEIAATEAGIFATRRLYGRYLRALLYQEMTESGGRVRLGADDVVRLSRGPEGWRLHCASGREVIACRRGASPGQSSHFPAVALRRNATPRPGSLGPVRLLPRRSAAPCQGCSAAYELRFGRRRARMSAGAQLSMAYGRRRQHSGEACPRRSGIAFCVICARIGTVTGIEWRRSRPRVTVLWCSAAVCASNVAA